MDESSTKGEIASLERRLDAIENDEFMAAKRLYIHAQRFTFAFMGVATVFFGLLTIFSAVEAFNNARTAERMVTQAEERIDRLLNDQEFHGFEITYTNPGEQAVLYWNGISYVDEKITLNFTGYFRITGIGPNYGLVETISILASNTDSLPHLAVSASRRDHARANMAVPRQVIMNNYINETVDAGFTYTLQLKLNDCDEYIETAAFLQSGQYVGSLNITPVILNMTKGTTPSVVPFVVEAAALPLACPNQVRPDR